MSDLSPEGAPKPAGRGLEPKAQSTDQNQSAHHHHRSPKIPARFAAARPISRKYSPAHIAMKRAIRPIAHARDEAALPCSAAIDASMRYRRELNAL